VGPFGSLQIVADMVKLLFKEDWVPPFAEKAAFITAPVVGVVTVLLAFAVIPFGPEIVVARLDIGLLFFLGMTALGVYSVILGGWSSNSKYSLLGGLRAMVQMLSYEVFMAISLMGVVMMSGSFDLGRIVEAQGRIWFFIPQFVGFAIFLTGGIAVIHRTPFDLPEADSELVAGYHTEYSGMKFGLFFLAEYVGILLVSAMTVTLFFGGWRGPWLPPLFWFALKTVIVVLFIILVRATLPRLRFDQLLNLGWKIILPLSLLNLLVTGGIMLYLEGR
jgi:NADH-quinone oxidoreductase subunit H